MNTKKITQYFMVRMIEAADDGVTALNHPKFNGVSSEDQRMVRKQFADIRYYARMIIEKDGVE